MRVVHLHRRSFHTSNETCMLDHLVGETNHFRRVDTVPCAPRAKHTFHNLVCKFDTTFLTCIFVVVVVVVVAFDAVVARVGSDDQTLLIHSADHRSSNPFWHSLLLSGMPGRPPPPRYCCRSISECAARPPSSSCWTPSCSGMYRTCPRSQRRSRASCVIVSMCRLVTCIR